MGPVRGEIQWNEVARVLLIETVIQVEEEIRNNPNIQVSGKWDRINSLLPRHLRGRTWSCQQAYDQYKCSRMFATLVEVYRGMKYRKPKHSSGQVILTKPVFDAMKKREDLSNSQRSSPVENGLKSVSMTRASNSTDQKLPSTSITVGDYSNAEIQWNETARVLLIETVIQVEEEIRNNPDVKSRGKWNRINNRLPPHLRGRTWSCQQQTYNHYKSARIFGSLVEVYRGMKRRMPKRSRGQLTLTKPVFDAMKKREDLLNSQRSSPVENGLKSVSVTRASNSTDQKLPSTSITVRDYSNAEIQWNETARVLLIETVIQVEEEIRNNPDVKSCGKWNRINNRLPPHLRGRTWSCQQQTYNHYKSARIFGSLVEVYRGMKRRMPKRSRGQLTLTKPVFDVMKKREDLLNAQRSKDAKNGLKSGIPTRVSNNTDSAGDQKLPSSNIKAGDYSNANKKWNETTHILLVEAVIQVEEEIRNNPNLKITGKWNRINHLLPSHLRGRSSGSIRDYKCRRTFQHLLEVYRGKKRGRYNRFLGLTLTKPVLEILKKREDMLNTGRSTPSEKSLNSGNPTRVSSSCSSVSDPNLLSPNMNSFTNTRTNRGHSPERQTTGNATERKEEGANFAHTASDSERRLPWTTELHESFVDAVNEVGGAVTALPEDVLGVMGVEGLTIYQVRSHLQMYRLRYIAKSTWEGKKLKQEGSEDLIATTHAPSTNHSGSSLGYASKSVGESEGPENQSKSTSSPLRHSSKSVSESFQDPETMADSTSATARLQSGFETGAPKSRDCRSSKRPPSDHSPTFMSDSKACIRYDEHLHSILDEMPSRLGLEFSSLSSWVESKLIPDGKKIMYAMTSSTNQSVKRRKLNAGTDPLDDILQQSRSRWIDLQIRASFQRLKVQFVEELKNTSMEVLQQVRQDIYLHYCSSDSSHGERKGK